MKVTQLCLTLCNPMDYIVHGILASPGDLPNPGNEPRSPSLQTDSLPAEPQWYVYIVDFPCGSMVKNLPVNAGDIRDMG